MLNSYLERKCVNIHGLKIRVSKKYPSLTSLMQTFPDEMEVEEFIGAVGVWLFILDTEKQHSFSSLMRNNKEAKK